MTILNYVATKQSKVIDTDRHYMVSVLSRPREPERIFDIDPSLAQKRNWSIENSVFKDY
jgi:hypothetical protein